MCGIFGYISFENNIIDRKNFEHSLQTIIHRGPDFQKSCFFNNDKVALGHVRLSIIDLSEAANQPMAVDQYYVIFNGEIYNYIELKNELILKGYTFNTNSDTEVLVKSFDCWGEECVNKFNGMWGFAIYNTITNSLFCSRDRFGVKPFNYFSDSKRFIFSSEIKPIITYDPNLRRPNYHSIGLFCREGVCGEIPETWFENIYRLLPGHNLSIVNSKITISKYYSYQYKTQKISLKEAKEQFYELFIDALKLRMRSDVPVGVTLSSGLDSTSIVAGIRQFNTKELNTYTAHFQDFIDDEYPTAAKTNQYFKLKGNSVLVNYGNDYIENLNKIIYHLESGHLSPSIFPMWRVYKEAKKEVTVVLEGQGADELLAGYLEMCVVPYLQTKLFKFQFRSFFINFQNVLKYSYFKTIVIYYLRLMLPYFIRTLVRRYILNFEGILIGKLKGTKNTYSPVCKSESRLARILQESHQTILVNLLHYGDAISMAFSIESRLPFMDYRLVDFVMSLPADYLIAEGKGKFLLRESLKHILPEYINAENKKLGFPSPIHEFFIQNRLMLEKILLSERTMARGIFDKKKLKKFVNSDLNSILEPSRFLFRVLCVELWFRMFIDQNQQNEDFKMVDEKRTQTPD